MIKWQVIVTLPDDLYLGDAVKIKHTIEKSCGLPCTLKIERITSEKSKPLGVRQGSFPWK